MKFIPRLAPLAVAVALGVLVTPAPAQFQKPEDAIKYRQSALFLMGQHFGRLGAMAHGRIPFDAKVAAANADLVAELARLPWSGFVPGTDKGSTQARTEVWTEAPKFKEAQDKVLADIGKLAAAARAGNPDALKSAFGATAGSCKSCHDAFRAD